MQRFLMKKIVGIIGGMGTMATVDLFRKIVENTPAKSDQEHLHILIDNNSEIPDRIAHILKGEANPVEKITESARNLISIGAKIIMMGCNTVHYFYEQVKESLGTLLDEENVEFLHLINETVRYIEKEVSKSDSVYLLGTEVTYKFMLYKKPLEEKGMKFVCPSEELQRVTMEMIYNYKNGVNIDNTENIRKLQEHADLCGAKKIILGCTELPLIFAQSNDKRLLDPTDILAKATVQKAQNANDNLKQ